MAITYYLFNTENKKLLHQTIQDTDKEFAKWALINLMKWDNKQAIRPLLKVNGNKDRLIPAASESVIIKDGGHFMVVDKPQEISLLIKDFLIKLSKQP